MKLLTCLAIAVAFAGALALLLPWLARRERARQDAERRRRHAVAPPTGGAWRAWAEAEGLGHLVARAAPRVRPAWRLETTTEPTDSWIGGLPDLPEGTPWPMAAGRPLAFVARIAAPTTPGALLLFCDPESMDVPEGVSPAIHVSPNVATQPRAVPPGVSPWQRRFVRLVAYEDVPEDLGLADAAEQEAWIDLVMALAASPAGTTSKLGGYANPVQGAMEPELGPPADDWRLLVQIDSEGDLEIGDAGMLYYWIRAADLEAGRFDRVALVSQCH